MNMKRIRFAFLFVFAFAIVLFALFRYTSQENLSALKASTDRLKDSVIIIDAGHGGVDGGTVARDGTLEKDINLSIALKLNDILRINGIQTRLTRAEDISIHDADARTIRQKKISDIHNRLKIIEETENCVFVSIHQNHYTQSKYHGTQVFYSGNHPNSSILADSIQRAVSALLQPENARETKKSGTQIYLLYHAQKPAVMVECGFLSNDSETEQLKTEKYQYQLAVSIYNGILNFFSDAEEV